MLATDDEIAFSSSMMDIVDITSVPLFRLVAILPSVFSVLGSTPTKFVIVASTRVISANNDSVSRFLNVVNVTESVESTTASDDIALNTEPDIDAILDPRINACDDSVESTDVNIEYALNTAVDNDATSDPRADTQVESAVDCL